MASAVAHQTVYASTLYSDFDSTSGAYDAEGCVWSFRFERPSESLLKRFMRLVFYNPRINVGVQWTRLRTYQLTELREAYLDAVRDDDDVLTQFVEAEEIEKRIGRCETFDDVVKTWEWMSTDPD